MDKVINEWLLQYEKIKEIAEMIHTEELPDATDTLALQRSGVENLGLKYVGEKGWYRQYQYVLLLKANSEDDLRARVLPEGESNGALLDKLYKDLKKDVVVEDSDNDESVTQ